VDISFITSMPVKTMRTVKAEVRWQAMELFLNSLPVPDITAWTDGSAVRGNRSGGAGVVMECLGLSHSFHGPAGARTFSFQAECVALALCLEKLKEEYGGTPAEQNRV
jgi:hypothetical protein